LILLALCVTFACRRERSEQGQVRLVASGDTAGWIVPCGCTTNQSGGLLRRGSYLNGLRRDAAVVYVDVGGAVSGTSDYDRLKLEAILRGELSMGLAAHNIGAAEAGFGADYLRELQRRLLVPWLSCNVRDKNGELLGESIRIVQAAGRRIALIGVLAEDTRASDLQIDAPHSAILAVIQDHAGSYDALVVLAYCGERELLELAANLPEVDVVIGGPTGQSVAPRHFGPTLVTSATNKGKFLAQLTPPAAAGARWTGEVVEMTERFEDDEQQKRNLDMFYAALAEQDLAASQTSFVQNVAAHAPQGFRIAGMTACCTCHAADCDTWNHSSHAHAWQSLTKSGAHVDAYCQQCHTTGFGLPGGFVSVARSEMHASVSCESCHGPSEAHVQDPETRTAYAGLAADQCVRCHDRENSPTFEYEPFWQQVRHGGG
jgi:hypothetical protein